MTADDKATTATTAFLTGWLAAAVMRAKEAQVLRIASVEGEEDGEGPDWRLVVTLESGLVLHVLVFPQDDDEP